MTFAYLLTFCLGGVTSQLIFDTSLRDKAKEFFTALTTPRSRGSKSGGYANAVVVDVSTKDK
jgi:hypothetical protein